MTKALEARVETLLTEIQAQPTGQRGPLLDQLEQVVMSLDVEGGVVPAPARALIAAHVDARIEDQFDNMPL